MDATCESPGASLTIPGAVYAPWPSFTDSWTCLTTSRLSLNQAQHEATSTFQIFGDLRKVMFYHDRLLRDHVAKRRCSERQVSNPERKQEGRSSDTEKETRYWTCMHFKHPVLLQTMWATNHAHTDHRTVSDAVPTQMRGIFHPKTKVLKPQSQRILTATNLSAERIPVRFTGADSHRALRAVSVC